MQHTAEPDTNTISHIWMRINAWWLFTGALSGALAGLVVILLASAFTSRLFGDWTQPFKLVGASIFGAKATAYGPMGAAGMAGALIHVTLSIIYGVVFAHLVHEKSKGRSLIILGLVTSFIIWVFATKLFLPSFDITLAETLPSLLSLALNLLFGLTFGIILALLRPVFLK